MLVDYINSKFDSSKPKSTKAEASGITKRNVNKESEHSESKCPFAKLTSATSPHAHHHHDSDHKEHKVQEHIGGIHQNPSFLVPNNYLHTGYRVNFNNKRRVFKSLFMMHNESVNIWTHLGGAIIAIALVVFLSFSVHSFDTQTLNHFVKEEVQSLFVPIYDHLPNFVELEHQIEDKVLHTAEDMVHLGEKTIASLESSLHTVSEEIEHVMENIHPELIGKFLTKLKEELQSFSHLKKSLNLSSEKNKIKALTDSLEKKLNNLQSRLVNKIDSSAFDWIDIYKYIKPSYNQATEEGFRRVPLSRWPIIVFLITAVFCLLCSAVYHAFCCISDRANQVLRRLDYAGISILITGSCFPPFVYGFYCQPIYAQIYLSLIGATSLVVFVVSLGEKVHRPEYGRAKALMYGALGVFAGLPGIHLVYLNMNTTGISDNLDFMPSTPYYLTMGVCYLGGLAIYASKYPEKMCPGKFDLWGHSHQIWHVCVLLGIVFTYLGAFDNYYTRIKIPCIGCDI